MVQIIIVVGRVIKLITLPRYCVILFGLLYIL